MPPKLGPILGVGWLILETIASGLPIELRQMGYERTQLAILCQLVTNGKVHIIQQGCVLKCLKELGFSITVNKQIWYDKFSCTYHEYENLIKIQEQAR